MHQSLPSWILSSRPAHFVERSRYWLLALISFLLVSGSARAGEWLTLQVPLSRSAHTLKLWEADGNGGYTETITSTASLYQGYYDSFGNWYPLATSYAQVQVERSHAGDFWLKDVTAGQFGPPNQIALVNAVWRHLGEGETMRYFSIPGHLHGHTFAVVYSTGETLLPGTGAIQGTYSPTGEFTSLGFFEAFVGRLSEPPYFGWRLVDLTDNTMGPVEETNLIGAQWEIFTGTLPVEAVEFMVALFDGGASASRAYTLYVEGGAAQSLVSTLDNDGNEIVTGGTVGIGRKYWLIRDADQTSTPQYQMVQGGGHSPNVTSFFPPVYEPQMEYRYFQFYGPFDTNLLSIQYNDGTSSSFSWFNSSNYLEYWDANGNISTEQWTEGYAYVDVGQTYWIRHGWDYFGAGPQFYFPGWTMPGNPPPEGTFGFDIYGTRAGSHTLQIQDSSGGLWNVTNISSGTMGGNFGPNGEWVEWPVTSATSLYSSGSSPTMVRDLTLGDTFAFGNWFIPSTFNVKISASRFGHDLRVRLGNGEERPLQAHAIQGAWVPGSNGVADFLNYGYFDATVSAYSDLPWWLLDYSQIDGNGIPKVLNTDLIPLDYSSDIDSTDTDGDGWADWHERFVGTNPNNVDTDGDGTPDPSDPNPRANPANTSWATLRVYTPLE